MKNNLQDEEKNLADVLMSLHTDAFNRFKNRQYYEWRLSISLWTASAILLGFLLKGDIHDLNFWIKGIMTFFAIALSLSHYFWFKGAGKRTQMDTEASIFFEQKIQKLIDVDHSEEYQKELANLLKTSGKFLSYSYLFQFSITCLISIAIICVVWIRDYHPQTDGFEWIFRISSHLIY
jgi:hypothetical protein